VSRKAEKREKSREVKAEKAALIDRHIEEELLKNLQSGKYSDIWNVSQKNWEKVLDKEGVVEHENEQEFDSEEIDNIFVSDLYGDGKDDEEGDDGLDGQDFEDEDPKFSKGKKSYADEEDFADYDNNDKSSKGSSKKTNNTSLDKKKFVNKKRPRNDKAGKKGKLNVEYEYEDKNKDVEHNYNDW
jgi:protein MAK16